MCYSAMVVQSISKLQRSFDAQVDFGQIEQTFKLRSENPQLVKITRAFEQNFDEPTNDAEKRIREVIEDFRSKQASKLEGDLFKQKTRLVEAERAIAAAQQAGKAPTKKALNDQRVATDKIEDYRSKLTDLRRTEPKAKDSRIFPRNFAPIIVKEDGQNYIRLARYLLRRKGMPPSFDDKFSGAYNSRRDNLFKFWRPEVGKTHALMVVDSFYENVERNGANAVLHFKPANGREMLIACLYSPWGDPEKGGFLTYSAVTDEPPDEVRSAGHDRIIVNLADDAIEDWLTPAGRSDDEIQSILDRRDRPFYEHQELAA